VAPLFRGRYTAHLDGPFVVFLIGMRINQPWKVWRWLPTLLAMGPMLRELYMHPEKGFRGAEFLFSLRGPLVLQYWRSFDHLERFARAKDDPHLPAWSRFNRAAARDGSVGVFHETFLVDAGRFESVYVNMPRFGLAAAAQHVPVGGAKETARGRLGTRHQPGHSPAGAPAAAVAVSGSEA
jgi:hypothetical protein